MLVRKEPFLNEEFVRMDYEGSIFDFAASMSL